MDSSYLRSDDLELLNPSRCPETLSLSLVTRFGGEEMLSSPSTVRKKETSVVASILSDQKKTTTMIGAVGSNGLLVKQDGFSSNLIVLLPDLRGDRRL
ncbi:hypothetical protein ACLOJK_028345 [Asimina triloba]